LIKYKIK